MPRRDRTNRRDEPRVRPSVGAHGRAPATDFIRDGLVAVAAFACPLVWNQPVLFGTTAHRGHAIVMSLSLLAFLAHITGGIRRREILLPRPWSIAPAAAVVLAAAVSTITSVNKNAGILFTLQLLTGALLFCLVAIPGNSRTRNWAAGALVSSAGLVGLLGVREYALQRALGGQVWRVFGLFFNPNLLAAFLAIVLPLAIVCAVRQKRAWRLAAAVAAALMILALLLTGSRGGLLAFLAGALVFFAAGGVALGRARLGLLGAAGAVLAAAVLAITLPPLRARLATAFSGEEHLFRVLTWKATLHLAQAYPALGSGPGTFEFIFPKHAIAGFTRMAHQNYLQTLAENGPAGLAAFLWLMAASVIMCARAVRRAEAADRLVAAACLAGIAAFLVHSLTDYAWFIGGIAAAVWMLAGIGAGYAGPVGSDRRLPVRARAAPALAFASTLIALALLVAPICAAVAEWHGLKGQQALRSGDRFQAEADLRAAVAWAPLDGTYHRLLGVALGGSEGISQLRRAVALEPTSALPRTMLGRLLLLDKRPDDAAKQFEAAIRLNPHQTGAWLDLAAISLEQGRLSEAQRAYSAIGRVEKSPYGRVRALEQRIETDYAFAHYGLGLLCLKTDQQRARDEFRLAINIVLAYEATAKALDQALQRLGQGDIGRLGEVASLKARILWRLALMARQAGNLPRRDDLRRRALEADPGVQAAIEREDALLAGARY